VLEDHFGDTEEHAEVIQAAGISAWVIWHEKEEQDKDQILHAERKPIY